MNTPNSSEMGQNLLADMARIPVIIPGKLSERRGSGGKITGWKLQHWYKGRNQTRYVPAVHVQKVKEGTAGHEQFMSLVEEYTEVKGREAFRTLDEKDCKKGPCGGRRSGSGISPVH
jgi:hypothetical protein